MLVVAVAQRMGDENDTILAVSLDSIPSWQSSLDPSTEQGKKVTSSPSRFPCNTALNNIIRIWKGEIWTLAVDAIVNSTNETLSETQGVSAAITDHAGPEFLAEVEKLEGCRTGEAKMTHGFALPARYFTIHYCVVGDVALRCVLARIAHSCCCGDKWRLVYIYIEGNLI